MTKARLISFLFVSGTIIGVACKTIIRSPSDPASGNRPSINSSSVSNLTDLQTTIPVAATWHAACAERWLSAYRQLRLMPFARDSISRKNFMHFAAHGRGKTVELRIFLMWFCSSSLDAWVACVKKKKSLCPWWAAGLLLLVLRCSLIKKPQCSNHL